MVQRGTATRRVSIALYGLRACQFGVYFRHRNARVSLVQNDGPPSFWVQWTAGILRRFQAFFWLRVFLAPKQNPRPPRRH